MSQIVINVDELRSISMISVEAAQIMDEANNIINSVVTEHDWKCPERVNVDNSLETIKTNISVLSETFTDFASQITEIANTYTEYVNNQTRMNTAYEQDIVSLITEFNSDGMIKSSSHSGQVSSAITELESTSLDAANVASLHGSADAINIVEFSALTE